MKTQKHYKFLKEGFKSSNGNVTWEMNTWKHQEGKMDLCNNGFHCSDRPYQAFSYFQGEILAQVEVKGEHVRDDDDTKECWSDMRIVKAWKWQKKDSVALAIYAAELVIDIFEKYDPKDKKPRKAIEAAKKWLANPTKKNSASASASASYSYAYSASYASVAASYASAAASYASASYSASYAYASASASASASYAYSASSAPSALVEKISNWMDKRLKELEEIK